MGIVSHFALAVTAPVISADDFYPIEKLKYGDTLIAKTRIDNNVMHSFPIEVMSINQQGLLNYKSIIATTKDPYILEVGLAQGMSGSPVYFKGRLVGAIAFGFSFVKKPIIGITPIEEMLGILTNQGKEPYDDYYDNFQKPLAHTKLKPTQLRYSSGPTKNVLTRWWEQSLHLLVHKNKTPAWNDFLTFTQNTMRNSGAQSAAKRLVELSSTPPGAPPILPFNHQISMLNLPGNTQPNSQIPNELPLQIPLVINSDSGLLPVSKNKIFNPLEPNFLTEQFPTFSVYTYPSSTVPSGATGVSTFSDTSSDTSISTGNVKDLEAGDYIGVNFVRGDINISAFGTITYIQDDFLLAFGHQMGNAGAVKLPLYRARTEMIVPRQDISFKVGTLLEEIGSVVQDRTTGIMGKLGEKANYLPITVNVKSPVQSRTFRFEVVNNKSFGPGLATFILNRMFFLYEGEGNSSTIDYTVRVDYAKLPKLATENTDNATVTTATSSTIILSNHFSSEDNFFNMFLMMNDMNLLYEIIQESKHERGIITNIALSINSHPSFDFMNIASVSSDKTVFRPGEMIRLRVGFDRYQSSRTYQEFSYHIPKNMKEGQYQIAIAPSATRWLVEAVIGKYDYALGSMDELIEIIANRPMANELSLWQMINEPGIQIKNQVYGQLPANQQKILLSSLHNEKKSSSIDLNYVSYRTAEQVNGFSYFNFTVKE